MWPWIFALFLGQRATKCALRAKQTPHFGAFGTDTHHKGDFADLAVTLSHDQDPFENRVDALQWAEFLFQVGWGGAHEPVHFPHYRHFWD